MEIIPVVDIMRGVAVYAKNGAPEQYRPVQSALLPGQDGDALALARAYQSTLGAWRCHVADLDAIQGWGPQLKLLRSLADPEEGFGPGLMVDAGVGSPAMAERVIEAGASEVVVGLERLSGFQDLKAIVRQAGGERVVFSLDLVEGKAIQRHARTPKSQNAVALELGARAAEAGCEAVLVLDLSAVGSESGLRNLDLIVALKRVVGVRILAGGVIRSQEDIQKLEDSGCDGALVGSALHAGSLKTFRIDGVVPRRPHPPLS